MKLVERHVIDKNHKFYQECDDLAWRSKNLYNYCNYLVRVAKKWSKSESPAYFRDKTPATPE